MKSTLSTCAATRGFAALAALSFLAACEPATPPGKDPSEAGAVVKPVDPAKKNDAPALAAKKDAAKDTTARDTPPEKAATKDAPPKGEPEPEAKPDDTPPSKPVSDSPAPDGPFAVVDLGVGTNVADRELEGRSERFFSDSGTLYAWVKIKNDADPQAISMVWFHEDQEKFRYALDIGTSPSWRTWTKKTIVPKTDMGLWSVRIENANGSVLKEVEFSVR